MIQLCYGNWVIFSRYCWLIHYQEKSLSHCALLPRTTSSFQRIGSLRFRPESIIWIYSPNSNYKKTMLVGGACATLREHENKLDVRKSELQRAAAARIHLLLCARALSLAGFVERRAVCCCL